MRDDRAEASPPPTEGTSNGATPPTERTQVRRKRDRGHYDRATIDAVLDAGMICHVGFAVDGRPWVFPTAYARAGDDLFLHGAAANFALGALASGTEACVTVTLLDGLVLARAAFNHSMNYRSIMLFGRAEAVEGEEPKRRAVTAVLEHLLPGRAADTRLPSPSELRATRVVRFPIVEGSAKVRTGAPVDDPADLGLPHWAGVLPLGLVPGAPIPDGQARADGAAGSPTAADGGTFAVPDYLTNWAARRAR